MNSSPSHFSVFHNNNQVGNITSKIIFLHGSIFIIYDPIFPFIFIFYKRPLNPETKIKLEAAFYFRK